MPLARNRRSNSIVQSEYCTGMKLRQVDNPAFRQTEKLVSAEVQRLGRPEKPEGSPCVIAAQPFVLCPAQIQGPDDWRVVYIRRVINPLVVRIGKPGVTNKDYVLPTVLL